MKKQIENSTEKQSEIVVIGTSANGTNPLAAPFVPSAVAKEDDEPKVSESPSPTTFETEAENFFGGEVILVTQETHECTESFFCSHGIVVKEMDCGCDEEICLCREYAPPGSSFSEEDEDIYLID